MSGVEIFIGAAVEHASEVAVIREAFRLLSAESRPAVIFANLNLGCVQIDIVVATADTVLVIEAKGFARPVRGGENGPWQVRLASGAWKEIASPVEQVRRARFAVRDSLRALVDPDRGYPRAVLMFAPGLPTGSLPYRGDRQVHVSGRFGRAASRRPAGADRRCHRR